MNPRIQELSMDRDEVGITKTGQVLAFRNDLQKSLRWSVVHDQKKKVDGMLVEVALKIQNIFRFRDPDILESGKLRNQRAIGVVFNFVQ